jgi:hypothetical protein
MAETSRKNRSAMILAVAGLLLILGSPFILLGLTIFEQTFIGTNYCFHLYKLLRIQGAIQALYEWLFPYT